MTGHLYSLAGGRPHVPSTRDPRLAEIEEHEASLVEDALRAHPSLASLSSDEILIYVRARGDAAAYLAGVHAVAPSRRSSIIRVWSLLRTRTSNNLQLENEELPIVERLRRGVERAGAAARTFIRGSAAYALDVGLRARLDHLVDQYHRLGCVEQSWHDAPLENPTPRENVIDLLRYHAWREIHERSVARSLDSLYEYAAVLPAKLLLEADADRGQLIVLGDLESAYREAHRAYTSAYERWRDSRTEVELAKVKALADRLYIAAEYYERWVESTTPQAAESATELTANERRTT